MCKCSNSNIEKFRNFILILIVVIVHLSIIALLLRTTFFDPYYSKLDDVKDNPSKYMVDISLCGDKDVADLMITDRDNILNYMRLCKVSENTVQYEKDGISSEGVIENRVDVSKDRLDSIIGQKQSITCGKFRTLYLYKYKVFDCYIGSIPVSEQFINKVSDRATTDDWMDSHYVLPTYSNDSDGHSVPVGVVYIQQPREYVYNISTKTLYHIV